MSESRDRTTETSGATGTSASKGSASKGSASKGTSGTTGSGGAEAATPVAPDVKVVTPTPFEPTAAPAPPVSTEVPAYTPPGPPKTTSVPPAASGATYSTPSASEVREAAARAGTADASTGSWLTSPAGRRALAAAGAGLGVLALRRASSQRRAAQVRMARTNSVARTLHDVGLAAWFGGSLMGAVGINGAAADVDDPRQRARVANAGWARWTPANLAAVAAHLAGGAVILNANKGRTAAQQNVATWTAAKTGLTAAALGASAYSRVLGRRMMNAGDVPVEGGTTPSAATPPEVESAQRQLNVLQWAIPALTGAILVANARMGEQQRPAAVLEGLAKKLVD